VVAVVGAFDLLGGTPNSAGETPAIPNQLNEGKRKAGQQVRPFHTTLH
jgi:hypothetical protein